MRLDGYVRVSRVAGRSGDAFISPGEQKERVRAWAKSQGHSIAKWHEVDQPGSKADRPGLNAAMRRIESGASAGLVVARLDRFGRSVQDSANLLARIRAAERGALHSRGGDRHLRLHGQVPCRPLRSAGRAGAGPHPGELEHRAQVGGRARHPRLRASPDRLPARREPRPGTRPARRAGDPRAVPAPGGGAVVDRALFAS